jgi:asparagine synthase (glutamine-hydrolysing)
MHEPMADFSLIPTWIVSRLAREQVTVVLSGDGGDELFYGYERFDSIIKNYKFYNLPYPVKYGLYGFDKIFYKNKHINSGVLFNSPAQFHRKLHNRFDFSTIVDIFPDLFGKELPSSFNNYYFTYNDKQSLLHQIQKAEFYGMMQKTLRKVDLASMEHSLEVRVPFLRKEFIESSLRYPISLNFGKGKRKQLLKDLLKRHVPKSPIDGRKRGFSVPLTKWIREELYDYFHDNLMNPTFISQFGVNKFKLETMLQQHRSGKKDHKWPLFTMLALYAFQKKVRNLYI